MKNQVSNFIKKLRAKKINKLQHKIMQENITQMMDKEIDVLVDYFDSDTGEFVGHSEKLSPTVDFAVRFVDNGSIEISTFVKVKIYDFDGSYLKGELL